MKVAFVHGDPDGIVSAVILDSIHNLDLIVFTTPYKLKDDLSVTVEKYNNINEIYIADLACSDFTTKNIIKLLSENAEVHFFDHHRYSLDLSGIVNTFVLDYSKCAARIVYDYYNVKNEHLEKLVRIAEYSDSYTEDVSEEIVHEHDLLYSSVSFNVDDNNFRLLLVKELRSKLPSQIEEVKKRSKQYKAKYRECERIFNNSVIHEDKRKIIYMISDSDYRKVKGFISKITSRSLSRRNKKIAITIFRPNLMEYVITVRSDKRSEYNSGFIVENIIKEFGGKGGGHRHAASVAVSDSVIDKVIERLKTLWERWENEIHYHRWQ